jgi:hypothetical protein
MESTPKKSLAQLRAEVKEIRKTLYKPISRSKKGDLEAEIARHKGVSAPSSTKSEAVAVPMVEEKPKKESKPKKETKPKDEQPKATKEEKKGKKAEPKKAEPKTEKKKPVAKKEKKSD